MFRSFDPDDPLSPVTGEVTAIRENGATGWVGVRGSPSTLLRTGFTYDDLGRRTYLERGNGRRTIYQYDAVSRLSALIDTSYGSPADVAFQFAYNPASQIVTRWSSNDSYSQAASNGTQTTVTNGLNQLATVNGAAATYDANGNMTTDPVTGKSYLYYESSNLLRNTPSPWTSLDYDAFDRLLYTEFPTTFYVFDPGSGSGAGGNDLIAQYDGSGVLQKRFVFASGGEPLVAYDADGTRTFLETDERGSVIALAGDSGANIAIDTYDEYGIPSATNQGAFQYAGMLWLSGPGLYAPRYRSFNAGEGRFNQTDPIGYAGDVNLYAYVLNDPVNLIDPLGLNDRGLTKIPCLPSHNCLVVWGTRPQQQELPVYLTGGSGPNAIRRPGSTTGQPKAKTPRPTKRQPSKAEICTALRAAASDLRNGNTTYAVTAGAVSAYYFARDFGKAISAGRFALIFLGGAGRGGAAGGEAGAVGGPWGAALGAFAGAVAGAAVAYSEATGNTTLGADAVDSLADAFGCP